MAIPKGLPFPVDMNYNTITQRFGENPGKYRGFNIKGHNGLDIAPYNYGRKELDVWTVDDGVIERAAQDYTGWGFVIDVRHSWGMSRYAHLKKGSFRVRAGQRVRRNEVLGTMGNTGNVWAGPGNDGTHLHLGFYPSPLNSQNGYSGAVDPEPYLMRIPVVAPPPANPTHPDSGDYDPKTLKAGQASVAATMGLAVRVLPNRISGFLIGYLPFNAKVNITDQYKLDGDVVYRKAEVWIAEYDGESILLKNA